MSSSLTTTFFTKTTDNIRRQQISRTACYYGVFFISGLVAASLGPTLNSLAKHTQTNLHGISFLFSARSIGYLLGSLLGGQLYDKLPGHPVMIAMLLVMGVSMVFVPMVPTLWLVTILLLMMGVVKSGLSVGGNTFLIWTHCDKVGPFMNGLHFTYGVGAFLAPLIINRAELISGDIALGYWIMALPILPIAVWLLRLDSPTPQIANKNNSVNKIDFKIIALIVSFFFLYAGIEISFGGWIYTYILTLELTNKTIATYLNASFWGALTIGRLLIVPIAVRIKPNIILFCDLAGCLFGLSVLLFWPNSLTVVCVSILIVGLLMASIVPTILSLAGHYVTVTGRVTSYFFFGTSVGGMTAPWLIGQYFETIGPQFMAFVIMTNLVLSMIIVVALNVEIKRGQKEAI